MSKQQDALDVIEAFAQLVPAAAEALAPVAAIVASDETLMQGNPTMMEKSQSSQAIHHAMVNLHGVFQSGTIELPPTADPEVIERAVSAILAS